MKTTRALTTMLAAICGITAYAATETGLELTSTSQQVYTTENQGTTKTQSEALTLDETTGAYKLSSTQTLDYMTLSAEYVLDLNGNDLSFSAGYLSRLSLGSTCIITNTSATLSTITFSTKNNAKWGDAFKKIVFGGNLKLVVKGDTNSQDGFQGMTNTHTGGTELDGYNASGTARVTTVGAFGSNVLTLSNGSTIKYTAAVNPSFTDLYSTGSSESVTNKVVLEKGITISAALHVAANERLNLNVAANAGVGYGGSCADVYGVLSFKGNQNNAALRNKNGIPNGTLEICPDTQVRCSVSSADVLTDSADNMAYFSVKELRTPEGINVATNANFIRTCGGSNNCKMRLKVGEGAASDMAFYGKINAENTSDKDWALEKLGNTTLTLGGENNYHQGTKLTSGAIRLVGSGTLGASGDVLFNGGELIFGADVATDPSSRFKTASGQTAKIGVDEGVTQEISGNLANCTAVEKTRAGTLVIPRETVLNTITITAGYLAVPGDPTWEDGDVVTLYSYTTSGSTAPVKDENFKITGLGARQDYTLTTEEEDGTTTVKATISNTVLGWTGGSGKWSDANAWNSSLNYQAGDAVAFNAASFASADSIEVEVDSDVSPSAVAFDIPEGKTLTLTGTGAITLAGNLAKNGAGTLVVGNGVNSIATKTIAVNEGILKLGADQPFDAIDYTLYVEENAVLDLNGHELMVGTATKQAADGGSCIVTNSVESVGTLTAGINNGTLGFNTWATFGGNVRYIFTGNNKTHFRDSNSTRSANTLTGAIVVSNNTQGVRIYGNKNTGTGNIGFAGNAKLDIPSQNLSTLTDFAGIEVSGTNNTFNIEGNSGGTTVTFKGPLTGDGELTLSNGFKPSIHLDGDTSGFEGTIRLKYNANETWRGLFFERANLSGMTVNDGTASMPKGAIVLDNGEDSTKVNKIWVAGMIYTSTPTLFEIGDLTTASADTNIYANSSLRTYKGGLTLKVGALNKSGTFAAPIIQQEIHGDSGVKAMSLVKTGTGTWTLNADGHSWGGTTTVEGGRLNLDGSVFSAGTEIIVTNATLGGIAVVTVPVTVKKDGVLAGSLAASSVTFDSGSSIEVAADASATATISGVVDVSGVTVRLTGALDTTQEYTILTAGSGSTGKATVVVDTPPAKGTWKTKWVEGEGGMKVLKGYFTKPGFVMIVR